MGKLLVLPANVRLDWKVIARYKHSSLFGLVVSNKGKKFYNIDTCSVTSLGLDAKTLSKMTFSITTLSRTINKCDTQHNDTLYKDQYHYPKRGLC